MEKLIGELLSGAAAPLVAALGRNSELLERVIAGQEAAMAKLEGQTGPTTARRTRAAKATEEAAPAADATPSTSTPAATEEPAAASAPHPLLAAPNAETALVKNTKTGKDESAPTVNYRAADFSRDQIKNEFLGWIGETADPAVRGERSAFVKAIGEHFGVSQLFSPDQGLTDDEQRKQTLFYLRRKREGLAVNFGAEYDFDGDPLADQTVEDEADPLG